MKVGASIAMLNTADWERVLAEDWTRPPLRPDWEVFRSMQSLGSLIEPLGFDSLWVSEHFGSPNGMVPNTLQFLAYWAARTNRIDLGTCVVVLPWWHPVKLAHELAMLDLMLEGRELRFGVGRGVSIDEYQALGVPQDESRERFAETLDIIERALTSERFSYDGSIFTIPEMSIRPQPRSTSLLDNVLCATTGPESMEAAAARGLDMLFVTGAPVDQVRAQVARFNTIRASHGFAPSQPTVHVWAYCCANEEDAEKGNAYFAKYQEETAFHYNFNKPERFKGIKGYERYYEQLTKKQGGGNAPSGIEFSKLQFVGTPETIVERARTIQRETSAKEIVAMFQFGGMPDIEAQNSMRLFAREALAEIQAIEPVLHDHSLPVPG